DYVHSARKCISAPSSAPYGTEKSQESCLSYRPVASCKLPVSRPDKRLLSAAQTRAISQRGRGAPMGHYKSNLRDIEFNLFEVLGRQEILGAGPYADMDIDTARSILDEVERLATNELAESLIDAD